MPKRRYLLLLLVIITSCAIKKEAPTRVMLKPLKISAQPKVFRQNADKEIDILHTELNVSFNWEKHLCNGSELITFKPYYYPIDSFRLDAKQFIFHNILLKSREKKIAFDTAYNGQQLVIYPKEQLNPNDEYSLLIDYTAQPDKSTGEGSRAISDAKGLYFINTDKSEPYKPTQIWTQGETESNSNWFATIDKPYEKMTFTIFISVPDTMTTLSNGLLENSTSNDKNMRTDKWTVKEPMSAYLVMMAIGNFKKTTEDWSGKEVSYYLEPKFHPYAKNIFNNTTEMLEFYSNKLGVPYPWEKYAQVVVRDYVSGAMENTSATLHGDFVQKNDRELVDDQNDGIIAHELFHQWFGDLVTCESWSHLTLNEGFATFGEQLWYAHKYGKKAELQRIHNSINSYLRYAKHDDDPIVRFYYKDKEEMFNAITYQKGARVLNLLKFTLGEEAFFAGVKSYLNKYSLKTAEIENLRHELEEVSGKDLKYFFNQWFLRGGHPEVDVITKIVDQNLEIIITQTQKDSLFSFPFQIRIGNNLKTYSCAEKETKITIPNFSSLPAVYLDPEGIFIGNINNKTISDENLFAYFQSAENYIEKMRILETINAKEKTSLKEDALLLYAINDADPDVSVYAIKAVDWEVEKNLDLAKQDLKRIATLNNHPGQKSQAIYILAAMNDKLLLSDFRTWSASQSYKVAAASLLAIKKINPQEALSIAKEMEHDAEGQLFTQIAVIYAEDGDSNCRFFDDNLIRRSGSERNTIIKNYAVWAKRFGYEIQQDCWLKLIAISKNDNSAWTRYNAMMAMSQLSSKNEFFTTEQKNELQEIMHNETDSNVKRQLKINKLIKESTTK